MFSYTKIVLCMSACLVGFWLSGGAVGPASPPIIGFLISIWLWKE